MSRFVLFLLVMVILAIAGPSETEQNCGGSVPPCGCWPYSCTPPYYFTACCCVVPPCDSWCGCAPWGFECSQVVQCDPL